MDSPTKEQPFKLSHSMFKRTKQVEGTLISSCNHPARTGGGLKKLLSGTQQREENIGVAVGLSPNILPRETIVSICFLFIFLANVVFCRLKITAVCF
jgi:hypothetical protein